MKTLREEQIKAEEEILRSSIERYRAEEVKKAEGNRATQVEKTSGAGLLEEVAQHIAFLRAEEKAPRGKATYWGRTSAVPDVVLACAALRVFWSQAVYRLLTEEPRKGLTPFLKSIGAFLEGACSLYFAEQEGILSQIASRTKDQKMLWRKIREERGKPAWTEAEQVQISAPLCAALERAGLLVVHSGYKEQHGAKKTAPCSTLTVSLTERASQLLMSADEALETLRPTRVEPLLCPPDPWRSLSGGGYLTKEFKRYYALAPSLNNSWVGMSARRSVRSGKLKTLFNTINTLQNIPLGINKDVLWLREYVRDNQIDIPGSTPTYATVEVLPYPEDFESLQPTEKAKLVQRIKRQKSLNVEIPALLRQWDRDTELAHKFKDRAFYFAYFLDFRCRVYPRGAFHHHRNEPIKALFQFHEGKPLGPQGLKWLMVHVANTGDFNKISKGLLEDRLAWVAENLSAIEDMVDDPENCRMWADADSPFCFYAACCDLVRALRSENIEEYVSHIPVALDGSNSGVQHYSAALRAPEGKFVCLTDTGVQDLYASVATQAFELVNARAANLSLSREESNQRISQIAAEIKSIYAFAREREETAPDAKVKLEPEEKELIKALKKRREDLLAVVWADEGITRSTVKRSVMTFAYSAAAYGFGQQIQEDYMGPLERKVDLGLLEEHPFGDDKGAAAARYLGSLVYQATTSVLPKVAEGMRWLQQVASLLAKEGKGVTMTTPLGFPVHIYNRKEDAENPTDINRLVVKLLDMRYHLRLVDEKKEPMLDPNRQKSSVAPNIIHGCDAAHLLLTAQACFKEGMQLLLIHDSFATHAGDVQMLSWTLRKTMVELYSNWCPFQQVYDEALLNLKDEKLRDMLPLPPEKGTLDLNEIHHALYAFM